MTATTVTVAIPALDEERHIGACLDAVATQTYESVVEVLVVDGGSTDATRELAASRPGVTVLTNPGRIQAAALNVALARAEGEVFIRVDGHTVVAPDYVERCVAALDRTGAAMVGGAMTPVAATPMQRTIATSMRSSFGAGPARFHTGGRSGWVDTVYLGAYGTELARRLGGYAEDVGVNEDAELAIRMAPHGGVWFDETIRSTYVPRSTLRGLARQFFRYGLSRAATVRRHPSTLRPRQAAGPLLVLGLLSPFRRRLAGAYAAVVAVAWLSRGDDARLLAVIPVVHLSWGTGFLVGLCTRYRPQAL